MHYPSRIAALETVFMFIRILYRLLRMSTKFRLPLNLFDQPAFRVFQQTANLDPISSRRLLVRG